MAGLGTTIFGGGALADFWDFNFKGLATDVSSPDTNNANHINSIDPTKDPQFQLPPNPTCDQLKSMKQLLQNQMAVMAQQRSKGSNSSSAVDNYNLKVQHYINTIDTQYNLNNCDQQLANELAQQQMNQDLAASKAALDQVNQLTNGGSNISPMTVGAVIGGVVFLGVIIFALSKSK